jgi:hypothetical protein
VSEAAGVATGRRSGVVTRLLAERAVVEQPCCDALIREPEQINPRVDADEPRVPFPDSDEVGSGIGSLGKSRAASFLMLGFVRFGDSFYFSFNPVLIDSYSCGRNSRSKQIESA